MKQTQAIRDLASLTAGIIRKMGAAYGDPTEWRYDFTQAVKIMEQANLELHSQEVSK